MAESGSFADFYAATVDRLLGQLHPVTGDLHEAEEVVQEAFARASVRWSWPRDYDVPEARVRRVAMNLAADRARRLRRQARAMLRRSPPPAAPPISVEALALAQALRTLPVRRRHVIVLHHLADLPIEEVARTLAIRDGTVKSLLARGRRALAAKLADPRRCDTHDHRPARTAGGAGRGGRQPRPHPRARGGAAPWPPAPVAPGRGQVRPGGGGPVRRRGRRQPAGQPDRAARDPAPGRRSSRQVRRGHGVDHGQRADTLLGRRPRRAQGAARLGHGRRPDVGGDGR